MRTSGAARRYAKALFSLCREEGLTSQVRTELEFLRGLIDSEPSLRDALMTPLHPARERKGVLGAVSERLGMTPIVRQFLLLLIDQRRLLDFEGIQQEFERLANEASGLVTATVVAASPLDERRQDRLRRALSDRTGQEVKLDIRVDPKLIGGAIATVGGTVFDGSLRTQLDKLRANLMKGS
jgi:F-type H+-transporting ATPase subunit delta